MSYEQLFPVLRRFAATMAQRFEINDVLQELTEHSTSILNAAGAGVSVAVDAERLRFVTATSERITRVERAQDEHQAGACIEAFRSKTVVVVTSPEQFEGWPEYRRALESAGLGAVVGLPLHAGGRTIGSLNVYDVPGRTWTELDLNAAQVLADISSAYLLHAGRLAEARQVSAQLQEALDSRVVIEQAKGMLSRDHGISVDEAFVMLRSHSRSSNANLRRVADAIVHGGLQLPTTDGRPHHHDGP